MGKGGGVGVGSGVLVRPRARRVSRAPPKHPRNRHSAKHFSKSAFDSNGERTPLSAARAQCARAPRSGARARVVGLFGARANSRAGAPASDSERAPTDPARLRAAALAATRMVGSDNRARTLGAGTRGGIFAIGPGLCNEAPAPEQKQPQRWQKQQSSAGRNSRAALLFLLWSLACFFDFAE